MATQLSTFAETVDRALAGSLRDEVRQHSGTFVFEACRIRVQSNSSDLIVYLNDYFRPFRDPASSDSTAAGSSAASSQVRIGTPEDVDIEIIAVEGEPLDVRSLPLAEHPPEPGKTRIKEAWTDLDRGRVVRKQLTGMVFLFDGQVSIASGRCLENANQVVNFINNRFIQWSVQRQWALCHAAGVTKHDRGVVIAGISGAGKSTLSLHLVARGLDFVSNDRILIRRQPIAVDSSPKAMGSEDPVLSQSSDASHVRMVGVAKLPRVNPGTIMNNEALRSMLSGAERDRYERMSPDELWPLEEKYDVPIDDVFGRDRFHLSSNVTGIYILDWSRHTEAGAQTVIQPIALDEHPHLLEALMKRLGVFYYDPTGEHRPEDRPDPKIYLEILRDVPAFSVAGHLDFAVAADAIEQRIAGTDAFGPQSAT
ncbi:MAG: HprK-related kinase B [Planctomycetota bacterium]